jgi:hypothetical protein
MAANSEIFEFILDSTPEAQIIHPGDSYVEEITSEKLRGDGYYGRSDGCHTVQFQLTNFSGMLAVQGSLEMYPVDDDWFTVDVVSPASVECKYVVDTTGLIEKVEEIVVLTLGPDDSSFSDSTYVPVIKTYNFQGNYVWLRIKISDWTAGIVNSIRLNH